MKKAISVIKGDQLNNKFVDGFSKMVDHFS